MWFDGACGYWVCRVDRWMWEWIPRILLNPVRWELANVWEWILILLEIENENVNHVFYNEDNSGDLPLLQNLLFLENLQKYFSYRWQWQLE